MPRTPRLLAAVVLSVSTLAPALVFADPPPMPGLPMSHSPGSYDLYYELRTYDWGCPKVDEAKKKAMVKHVADVVAGLTDQFDHDQFARYATDLKAWFDANDAGVPGLGKWDGLEKQYKLAKAALDAMPAATPTEPAAIKAAITTYQTIRAQAAKVAAVDNAITSSPCAAYPGPWYDLDRGLAAAINQADQQVAEGTGPTLEAYRAWKAKAPDTGDAPTTYWEHVAATAALIDYVSASVTLQTQLANLAVWAPALTGDDAATANEAAAAITAAIATAAPRAAALLPDVAMPPLKKDAGRTKLLDKALAGFEGTRVGLAVTPGPVSKESWTEDEVVRREEDREWVRTYTYVREHYTVYYAWKPNTPVVLAGMTGIDPADVCELWSQNFSRYTKGGPSVADKKKWFASDNGREGYILCKNASKVSKLKVK